MKRNVALLLFLILPFAAKVQAQDQWGVNFGLIPSWQTADPSRFLFNADRIDLHGSEVQLGFVRGHTFGGDWGLSYVKKSIRENSTLATDVTTCSQGECGTFFRTGPQTHMTGFEFHQFIPYRTWRERVQLGMLGSVGMAWMRGGIYKRAVTESSDVESFETASGELYPPSKAVVPLLSLEIAATGIVTDAVKVRASGGFSMPGYHKFSMSFIYMIPER